MTHWLGGGGLLRQKKERKIERKKGFNVSYMFRPLSVLFDKIDMFGENLLQKKNICHLIALGPVSAPRIRYCLWEIKYALRIII
jgi:hypothetical protein